MTAKGGASPRPGTRSTDDNHLAPTLQGYYDNFEALGANPKILDREHIGADCQACRDGCRVTIDTKGIARCPHGCKNNTAMLGMLFGPRKAATIPAVVQVVQAEEPEVSWASRVVDGGTFVLDAPDTPPAIWGNGQEILWAQGESLMICGPAGVGKTTLAVQLVAARCGIGPGTVLGQPVQAGNKKVLYLAMDRPPQIARAMGRLFTKDDKEALEENMIVWKGPPPYDMAKRPSILAEMATDLGADTVIVDSLKDAVLKLSDDESGSGYNRARQQALVAGVEIIELHHQRKASADNKKPSKLDDVYGSAWLVNGAGSVVVLWGEAGDPVVDFLHLKQPMEPLGPWQVIHDHAAGISELYHPTDVLAMLKVNRSGLTARLLATHLFGTDKPSNPQLEKARRKLQGYVDKGLAVKLSGHGQQGDTYHLAELQNFGGDDHD